jgi:DNA-binding NarL/FixJ family response regulator
MPRFDNTCEPGSSAISASESVACSENSLHSAPAKGEQRALRRSLLRRVVVAAHTQEPSRKLATREQQILKLIETGQTNRQIGEMLTISPNTVKGYVRTIYLKLGIFDPRK